MKKLLALALVAVIATGAMAQDDPNMLGMFFSPIDFNDDTTNMPAAPSTPFNAYVVLLNSTVETIGAYEVGITIEGSMDPFVLSLTGPNGFTNFGDNLNHLAGFTSPVVAGDAVVLSTMMMMVLTPDTYTVAFGASEPSSIEGDHPAIANGANPDELIACDTYSYPLVATINGDGVVATEAHSLSSVKALFN